MRREKVAYIRTWNIIDGNGANWHYIMETGMEYFGWKWSQMALLAMQRAKLNFRKHSCCIHCSLMLVNILNIFIMRDCLSAGTGSASSIRVPKTFAKKRIRADPDLPHCNFVYGLIRTLVTLNPGTPIGTSSKFCLTLPATPHC